jgi:hypothetical protein
MAAVTTDLEGYRREGEAFMSAIDEAFYRHFAGLSAELPVAPLYERHAHLFSPEAVRDLRAAGAEARGDGARGLRALAEFAAQGHLGQAVRTETEAIAAREAAGTVTVEGETMGYRQVAARIANEPDRRLRGKLEDARLRVVEDELNPLHYASWTRQHDAARDLGAASYRELYADLRGLDLEAIADQGRALLGGTEEIYLAAMDRSLRRDVGVGLDDATRSDLPRLFRADTYDRHFPSGHMVAALERTLEGLGIDLRRQENVILDTEARPGKDPRAFCSPVVVPDRVYLVVAPIGGVDDYRALFHEAGHTEHHAHVGRELPFEFRCLGDSSVTEAYAFLLEGLTHDPAWLTGILGFREHGDYVRDVALNRLYFHRRYAAKIAYELELHAGGPLDGLDGRYAEGLSEAVGLPWPRETWLADVDPGFYVASYLRAWALEVSLRTSLRERYGTRWFAQPRAGGFLRELWHEGQRLSGDEIASELDLPGIDLAVLAEEAHALLG